MIDMDRNFHILVEGEEDCYFLQNYTRYLLRENCFSPKWFSSINGKGNLTKQSIERQSIHGAKVIIIFDANSSHEETKREIFNKLGDLQFKLFLFPDNQSDGILENLLEKIVITEHKDIFKCFEEYKKCLNRKNPDYISPDIKGKIYGYKEALGAMDKGNKEKQFFPEYWNFDSPALNPLKDFLLENLK